ncbi:Ketosteroid isomerase-related protein [Mycobacterium rhizamassiliense]|uniref:Ketosteroid isomerase-related protein n=2 Tax=Mycobacterium TaxID=1763 RepID=A0A2U3PA97_9MYCO|nr:MULTISPECIES: nuclear transport factor 2 family protein [Mycobacterium]SPM34833.1 Ketosteroid isomerase-related protein [Mycobacterium rhizamassiliense]SPM40660.1 Ketosteroid isomerase-related protein [Mycobacterium numidiamassiliense]
MTTATTDLAGYPARYFAAWGQRDLAAALCVIADNVDWQDPSLPEPITGREAAAAFFTAAWSGFPDLQMQPIGEALVDEANRRICQEWRMVGTHTGEGFPPGVPPSGRPFDVTGTDIWQVDETGRAVCVHAYWNVATLLTQLGLT